MRLATNALLYSQSIACIHASKLESEIGSAVITQLQTAQYEGMILPVTKKAKQVKGIYAYTDIAALPATPQLAIFCDPKQNCIQEVQHLADIGCQAILFLGSHFAETGQEKQWLAVKQICDRYDILVFGPNEFGFIFPWHHLHASLSPLHVQPGSVAFISQSQSMCQQVLDWAYAKQTGLSACICLNPHQEKDLALWLDTLSLDPKTNAIVLYFDKIKEARRFMSAARSAASLKKILVMSPHHEHALPRSQYLVHQSAIARAGMLQVHTTHELFAALGTLNHTQSLKNAQGLVLLSNTQALTHMALAALSHSDTQLNPFHQLAQLDTQQLVNDYPDLIEPSAHSGVISLKNHVTAKAIESIVSYLHQQKNVHAILVLHSPSLECASIDVLAALNNAQNTLPKAARLSKAKILTHFAGEYSAHSARQQANKLQIPTYRTPEGAVCAYMHLIKYRDNQIKLKQMPTSLLSADESHISHVKDWLNAQILEGKRDFNHNELVDFLNAYQIKVLSPRQREEKLATTGYLALLFNIQVRVDPIFGPVLYLLKQEKLDLNASKQKPHYLAVALLPLNMALATNLLLEAANKLQNPIPPSDFADTLLTQASTLIVRLSHIMLDHAKIQALDLDLMLTPHTGLNILDLQIQCMAPTSVRTKFAIKPYPAELEKTLQLKQGQIFIRPICPEDELQIDAFIQGVDDEDRYKRFFSSKQRFDHDALAKLTQIDYDREMALVAFEAQKDNPKMLGVSRIIKETQTDHAEFSILLDSQCKGQGIGKALLSELIEYARQRGVHSLKGITMPSNQAMIGLAKHLGFKVSLDFEDEVAYLELALDKMQQDNES